MTTDPDQLTPEQMADLQRQVKDVMLALLETLMLSGHSISACISAIAEFHAHLLGLVGGNPAKRLAGILPPFLDAANSAAEVRRIIDVVGPARTKEALLKELPNKKNEFRTRLALWVIDHLEKGRVI